MLFTTVNCNNSNNNNNNYNNDIIILTLIIIPRTTSKVDVALFCVPVSDYATTDGVTLDMLVWKSVSAPLCQSSPVLPDDLACDVINKDVTEQTTKTTPGP